MHNNYHHTTMKNYDNLDVNNPAPRCPVMLLLDTSGSMHGAPINELNQGLRQFLRETAEDEAASRSVELEVITFDSRADVAMPFTPIADVERTPVPLVANGMTCMGGALQLAERHLSERRRLYRAKGISSYRPWVILMTDGAPNDSWEEPAARMRRLGENGQIQYIGIEIGNSADHRTLCRILPERPGPIKLQGLRFREFFRWLTDSLKSVSTSAVSDQDKVQFGGIDDWGEL